MEDTVGSMMRSARLERNWTKRELHKKMGSRVSLPYLTMVEADASMPSPLFIRKLSITLGLPVENMIAIAIATRVNKFSCDLQKKYDKALRRYRKK